MNGKYAVFEVTERNYEVQRVRLLVDHFYDTVEEARQFRDECRVFGTRCEVFVQSGSLWLVCV